MNLADKQVFPYRHEDFGNGVTGIEGGISLLEYFAARAPAEPQSWFTPKMPGPRPEAGPIPQLTTQAQRDEWDALLEGYVEPNHANDRSLAEAYEKREAQRKLIQQYDREAAIQRLIQWPFAWARAVLAAGEQV